MVRLYITRHGETIWNTQKRVQGWQNSELTEKGIRHAELLSDRLKGIEFTSIYTSPSKRAVKTAEILRGERSLPVLKDDNLREIGLGDWEGQTYEYLQKHYPEEHKSYRNTPHLYEASSGENFYHLQKRVKAVLKRITSENSSGNVLAVSHSVFIRTLLLQVKDISLEELWRSFDIQPTSLTIIELNYKDMKIILEGDMTHINKKDEE